MISPSGKRLGFLALSVFGIALLSSHAQTAAKPPVKTPASGGNSFPGPNAIRYEDGTDLQDRLISLFTRDENGRRACFGGTERMQTDPAWKDNLIFSEYFHGDNGAAIGAFHQTGWTGLIADLILRRHGAVPALGDVLRDIAGKAQQ